MDDAFDGPTQHVFDMSLHTASDSEIFQLAAEADAIVMTKDVDFVRLLERHGPPPRVVWVTCGNVSNAELWTIVSATWPHVRSLMADGEALVEVASRP